MINKSVEAKALLAGLLLGMAVLPAQAGFGLALAATVCGTLLTVTTTDALPLPQVPVALSV